MKNPDVFAHATDIFTMHRNGRDFEIRGGVGKMRTVTVVSLLQYQKFSNPLSNDASRCFYAWDTAKLKEIFVLKTH